jgi:hypothetical protein
MEKVLKIRRIREGRFVYGSLSLINGTTTSLQFDGKFLTSVKAVCAP